jgi:hypothetical protein
MQERGGHISNGFEIVALPVFPVVKALLARLD